MEETNKKLETMRLDKFVVRVMRTVVNLERKVRLKTIWNNFSFSQIFKNVFVYTYFCDVAFITLASPVHAVGNNNFTTIKQDF